jgi:hypothetical protein
MGAKIFLAGTLVLALMLIVYATENPDEETLGIHEILLETIEIICIVTLMMILVEWIQIHLKGMIRGWITSKTSNQIMGSSLLGVIPGCAGTFLVVSLYTHGLVGFGALTATMLATMGEGAFVMLTELPLETAMLVFFTCFLFGVVGGFLTELIVRAIGLKRSKPCAIEIHSDEKKGWHFFTEHIYEHIIIRHIPRLSIWIFFTLLTIEALTLNCDMQVILQENMLLVVILAALIGIIPGSELHLFFILSFADGLVPLSVLLTNSLVQDGHGLLPLLSHSPRDTIIVKLFNVALGLMAGLALFYIGI